MKYVTGLPPNFLGLYGDQGATAALAKEFKIFYAAKPTDSQEHYMVTHSNAIFVVDLRGRLRLLIDAMAADVARLLRE